MVAWASFCEMPAQSAKFLRLARPAARKKISAKRAKSSLWLARAPRRRRRGLGGGAPQVPFGVEPAVFEGPFEVALEFEAAQGRRQRRGDAELLAGVAQAAHHAGRQAGADRGGGQRTLGAQQLAGRFGDLRDLAGADADLFVLALLARGRQQLGHPQRHRGVAAGQQVDAAAGGRQHLGAVLDHRGIDLVAA